MPSQESQGILSPFLKSARYRHAVKYIPPAIKLLDVGCGAGELRRFLPANTSYHGVDIAKHWPSRQKNLFQADLTLNIPTSLNQHRFDVITALAVIEHVQKPVQFLKNIKSLLHPSGLIIITTPHPKAHRLHEIGAQFGLFSRDAAGEHHHFFNYKDIKKLAKQSSLTCTHYKSFQITLNQLCILTQ